MLWTLKLIYTVLTISDELLYNYPYYDFDCGYAYSKERIPYDRVFGANYDRLLGAIPYDRVWDSTRDPLLSSKFYQFDRIKEYPLLEAMRLNPRLPQVLGPIN